MLWFDRGGMDSGDYAELRSHVGQDRPRVLAWAPTSDGVVVGLPDRLAVRSGETWSDVAWADIVRGGWDPADNAFSWTLYDGGQGRVEVSDPARMPELFRERVTASIVCTEHVRIHGKSGATLSGRRNPATPLTELMWQVLPDPDIDPDEPKAAARIAAELQRMRAEYAIS